MINPFNRNKDAFSSLEQYEEDVIDYNEPEIIESFTENESNEYKQKDEKKYRRYKRIINIAFIIIMIMLTMVTIDVIAVSRYNSGPFFAIKTKTYKDGGTKEYYGLGYKVIKYHQVQGRRDKEIGFWNLKYNINPTDVKDIDLALEFENNYENTSKKYYKKFIRFSSTVKEIDTKKNILILEYKDELDEDSKYALTIYCSIAEKKSNLKSFNTNDIVNIIGTVDRFKIKTKNTNNSLYLNDCFAESTSAVEIVEMEE